MALEAELYSFRLQPANESAAVVLPVKWGVGRGKPLSKSEQCFFTNLSSWVQSGETSMGYQTTALLVLDLFQSCSVQYYTSLCESVN